MTTMNNCQQSGTSREHAHETTTHVTVLHADTPGARLLGPADLDVAMIASIVREAGYTPSLEGRDMVRVAVNGLPIIIGLPGNAPLLRIGFTLRLRPSVPLEEHLQWVNRINIDAWAIRFFLQDEETLCIAQEMHLATGITAAQLVATVQHLAEEFRRRLDEESLTTMLMTV